MSSEATPIRENPTAGIAAKQSESSRTRTLRNYLAAYGFLAPAAIIVITFFFIPMLLVLYLSVTNLSTVNFTTDIGKMLNPENDYYVGLNNFKVITRDEFTPKILFNTVFYVLTTLAIFNVGMALLIALLTAHIPRRAGFFFRALWILPRITPSVIYILMWKRMMADPPFGILNQFNEVTGGTPKNYYQEYPWVFVVLSNGFIGVSFGMVIFTSAIESIPKDLMNASLVDGSTLLQRIRYIILPLLRWPLLFVVTYQTLSLLNSFEYILLLTRGGPGLYQTEVWSQTAYTRSLSTYFANSQWGMGAAFAVILMIIGVIMATIYMRVFNFQELVAEPKVEIL